MHNCETDDYKIEGNQLHPQRRELNLEEADKRGKELWESD